MQTAPPDLDPAELGALLARRWSLRPHPLEHLPVGFGSWHWRAATADGSPRFVTVDRIEDNPRLGATPEAALAALDRAFRTAAALRDDAGLEFVVGPLADAEGAVVHRAGERYAVSVFPHVDGVPAGFGGLTASDRRAVVRLLGRLHAAGGVGSPARDDLVVPRRDGLEEALGELDQPWTGGPLAEPARRALAGGAARVTGLLDRYDALVEAVRGTESRWVVTHGEPHGGNVLRAGTRRFLVDWDTVAIAPPERDLWLVLDAAPAPGLDDRALELYGVRWELADVAEFVAELRGPHDETEDTLKAFDALAGYLGPPG